MQISPRATWPRESDEKRFASILGLNILMQLWEIPGRSVPSSLAGSEVSGEVVLVEKITDCCAQARLREKKLHSSECT